MAKGILGTKVGMTQIFAEDGSAIPVTIVSAGPCVVVDTMSIQKHLYSAVRVGFLPAVEKRMTRPELGVFKKAGVPAMKVVREFRLEPKDAEALKAGDQIKVDIFRKGQFVDVTGTTKGRGFSGIFRRYKMKGAARDSASAHEHHRHIGAIGQRKTPGKVWKGKRMPGHFGVERVTIQNMQIVDVDLENNLLLLRGAVPGYRSSVLEINPSAKGKKDRPVVLIEAEVEDKKRPGAKR
jgi:large subunit ribosomal protein L3